MTCCTDLTGLSSLLKGDSEKVPQSLIDFHDLDISEDLRPVILQNVPQMRVIWCFLVISLRPCTLAGSHRSRAAFSVLLWWLHFAHCWWCPLGSPDEGGTCQPSPCSYSLLLCDWQGFCGGVVWNLNNLFFKLWVYSWVLHRFSCKTDEVQELLLFHSTGFNP